MLNIQSDVTSLRVQSNLRKANVTLNSSIERLSTGYRINHASDNAAILAISKNIQSQISGNRVALDNAQIGYNMLSVADDSLDRMQDIAGQIRDLSLEAMTGTYSSAERAMIQQEVNQRVDELYRQKNTTMFNQIKLFGPDETPENAAAAGSGGITLQIGANSGSNYQMTVNTEFELGQHTFDVSTQEAAATTLGEVDTILSTLSAQRSNCGSQQNVLSDVTKSLTSQNINLQSSYSSYMDTDYAAETARYTRASIMENTNAALLIQLNTKSNIALSLLTNLRT